MRNYIESLSTESVPNVHQVTGLAQPHAIPSPPPLENYDSTSMHDTLATAHPFAYTSCPFDSTMHQQQSVRIMQNDMVPSQVHSQVQHTSQIESQTGAESGWLMPPQQHAQPIKSKTSSLKGQIRKAERQGASSQHAHSHVRLAHLQSKNNGDERQQSGDANGKISGQMAYANLTHHYTPGPTAGYSHDCAGNDSGALALHRPFDACSRVEDMHHAEMFDHF